MPTRAMNPRQPPPIPTVGEVFCTTCRMYRPNTSIAEARWSGPRHNQAVYICKGCEDRLNRHKAKAALNVS